MHLGPAQVLWTLDVVRPYVAPFADTIVHLVAEEAGPVTLGYGLVVEATTGFAECPPLDVLVIPGGSGGEEEDGTARWGRRYYERDEATLDFIRRQAAMATITPKLVTSKLPIRNRTGYIAADQ